MKYSIEDIDFFENDAILVVNGVRHYFQFPDIDATLAQALEYLFLEGKIEIKCTD